MSFFKLGKMTFGSLFKKPETTRYPFESRPQPQGLKGQIGIDVYSCILCGACERNCTTHVINVNKQERYWQIDRYGCIQCGYCITSCPKSCLYMLPDYAPAADEKIANRFDIPEAQPSNKAPEANAKTEESKTLNPNAPEQVPSRDVVDKIEQEDEILTQADYQLEDLIELMDDERAEKVRKALTQKS